MRKRKIHFAKIHCWSETKTNLMSTETPTEKKAEISVSNRQNIGHSRKNCLNLDSRSCLNIARDWKKEILILDWKKSSLSCLKAWDTSGKRRSLQISFVFPMVLYQQLIITIGLKYPSWNGAQRNKWCSLQGPSNFLKVGCLIIL